MPDGPWNPAWDGTNFDAPLVDLPDFEFIGAVAWDADGFTDTAVWHDTVDRGVWYFQDRDHGGPYAPLQVTDKDGVLRHLGERRVGSCDTAIRGLALDVRIRRM